MFLSDLSIKRPVLMSMILVVFVMFGILSYNDMSVSLLPEFTIPAVTVQTIYPGASPNEVETQITKKIEDELLGIGLLDDLTSYSMENVSVIVATFELTKDEKEALQDVKDKVDQILNDLPDGAERPVVKNYDVTADPVMLIAMRGDMTSTELYDYADNVVKDRIAQINGVGSVAISGGSEREIRVELNKRDVYESMLSPLELSGLIAASDLDMPAGNFTDNGQEYSVRLKGKTTLEALENLDIPTATGVKKLHQIAVVKDSAKEKRQQVTFFNRVNNQSDDDVVLLTIMKTSSANAVQTVDDVIVALKQIEKDLGNGISLTVVEETGSFAKDTVNDSFSNVFIGVILTILILLLFLHNIRSALIVGLAIPVSIIAAFIGMKAFDINLNMMTLLALSSASGTLISGAVVVLENIMRHRQAGEDSVTAASVGTAEVATAVVASILTNVVVFTPIAMMDGLTGVTLKSFAVTTVIVTLFSLMASFTITPMLASRILSDNKMKESRFGEKFELLFERISEKYKESLAFLIKSKIRCLIVVLICSGLFLISAMALFGTSTDFIPPLDNGKIQIEAELTPGAELSETAATMEQIEHIVTANPSVETVLTSIGKISDLNEGVNVALMKIDLVPKEKRRESDREIAAALTKQLSNITNAQIRPKQVAGSKMADTTLKFYIEGQDMERLTQYSTELLGRLKKISGLMNITTSLQKGKKEILMHPGRTRLSDYGITVQQLAMILRMSIEGLEIAEYEENGNNYDIRVVFDDASTVDFESLKSLPITTKRGVVPISSLVDLEFTDSYNKILHNEKYTAVEFTAGMLPGVAMGDMITAINVEVEELKMPSGYKVKWTGTSDVMGEMLSGMMFAIILAVILVFMLLAGTLENFTQPLLIMTTVPLCLIGVAFGLWISGATISLVVMLSMVVLVGIVVNNAILLLDYTNQLRAEGYGLREALQEACAVKLKPIIMSNLATVLGMLPMALGIGAVGSEIRQPYGIASVWGIIASTFLTLYFIPAAQSLVRDEKRG